MDGQESYLFCVDGDISNGRHEMAKRSPWHSIKAAVHHNNSDCNTGNNIETENLRSGTGGKPLCSECARLK